ncbi:MAG: hypothetical protein INF92_17285 [Rhodobacter sp.]|nr:hypothetical protein [Rhodobacter sp.]
MKLADLALCQRHDLGSDELRLFKEARDVLLVARKAIERLGENNVCPTSADQVQ